MPTLRKEALGPHYWRSLDELAETPAFRDWVEREFPQGASEWADPVSRRHFVKIMSASFLLAGLGLTGCRRPEETIYPFSKMPENYVHGLPSFFATAMPGRRSAQALLVKSLDGRPLKIEGNPGHPLGQGGTDRFAQASILNLYDPDRAARFLRNGQPVIREVALDYLSALARQMAASGGDGVCFLMTPSSSPSRDRLQRLMAKQYPKARWFSHEAVDHDAARAAASLAFPGEAGSDASLQSGFRPYYRLDAAKVVVSLDGDFLGTEADCHRLIRDFTRGRKLERPDDTPNRLYAVEPLMTLTGVNADHRLRLHASQVPAFAAHLALAVLSGAGPDFAAMLKGLALPEGVKPEWIQECAADLRNHRGASLVLAGHRQPVCVHLLALAMNSVLGNLGATVELHPFQEVRVRPLLELAQALTAGEVKTLIICGGNPVYTGPCEVDWAVALRKAGTVVRLGYYEDETTPVCHWHLPAAHYLESWGDARTGDGTITAVQPLIAPLFDGLTELELLGRIAGLERPGPYEVARETFRGWNKEADVEVAWKRYLRDGFLPGTAFRHARAELDWSKAAEAVKSQITLFNMPRPAKDRLEVVFHSDYSVDDGTHGNNGWLQEMPDPITKVCWENVATMSVRTAIELGVYFENPERGPLSVPVARLEWEGRTLEVPVWIQPGQADHTVGLALGYGRSATGRVGRDSGYNAYRLRTSGKLHFGVGGRAVPVGRKQLVATTQDHWAMEGRPIVREANLDQFRQHPDFVHQMDLDAFEPKTGELYQHPYTRNPLMKGLHQWGMSLDLNKCVGCSACMIACQSENNIPIVGKDQVSRGREMHWIRLDRYYSVRPDDAELTEPQVVTQPMLCQHCENAPCENVCPVNATVHDEEGLNVMVYNRCVGTRYCSNNCPYKVRRFNYFDYNQRPLDKLYQGPLAPKAMPDLVQMAKNPDVTVRMRGVMEKCTFCVQRIEQAKIAQKVKAGPSGEVRVPDGTITPACAQACPAEAIVFGDLADPSSRVSRLKTQSRDYSVLGFLNTKPRATYLARIRNPNPRMPDYYQQPLSLAEYSRKNGDPMAQGHETKPGAAGETQKGGH